MTIQTGTTPAGTAWSMCGEGEALVLIHGVGLDQSIWGGQCEGLQRDYSVITYDMLGHGRSPLQSAAATLEDYADQLHELLQHLNIDKAHVVGFSMGGLVARVFALRYPQQLTRLVIMGSVFNRSESVRNTILARTEEVAREGANANLQTALERWFSPEYRSASPVQIERVRELVLGNDPISYLRAYRLFAAGDNYLADQVHNIRCPVLVMTGELDPGSTPEMAIELANQLPDGHSLILQGQRHMMPMESPQQVNRALMTFLKSPTNIEQNHNHLSREPSL
ncbi:MAG: alpha/beta hydrolase [Oceanospirillaceae bacterium]|nr:alpha/beta hydrolase [Oceanospirillaceae bacterium]